MRYSAGELPFLTADLPGVGGRIKQRVEDFRVEEMLLYEPVGQGTHVYFRVVKTGLPTPAVVDRIADYMGVRPTDIGVAGLKDAQAVTSQLMSLEHVDPAKLAAFDDPQIRITWTSRHGNKLRRGHLAGNRFTIRIRGVGRGALDAAQGILDVLIARGVPNFFGRQRFGARGDTAALGEALFKGNLEEFVSIFLGCADCDDPPDCKAAREAFDAGLYGRALGHWPRHYCNERRALSAYKRKKRPHAAFAAIDKRMRRLYVSAFQSQIFNDVLCRRLPAVDRVFVGDMAKKTGTHGVFSVTTPEDAAAAQARADRFEISPTGLLPGYRCELAEGEPGQMEREAMARYGVEQEDFRRLGPLKVKGARRDLRFRLDQPALTAGSDEHGEFLELTFAAPPGCYATVALREIMKNQ